MIMSIIFLSFSIWAFSKFGTISLFSSRSELNIENQIVSRVVSYFDYSDGDTKLVVHPIEKYIRTEKYIPKNQFNEFPSLLDQFYEINNPNTLILQPSPNNQYIIDNMKWGFRYEPTSNYEIYVSNPAYDSKSGYVIVFSGNQYVSSLDVFRYKLVDHPV
jgi:hypothetical protein